MDNYTLRLYQDNFYHPENLLIPEIHELLTNLNENQIYSKRELPVFV